MPIEKEAMEILLKFLDKKCRDAEKEIAEKGTLSDENAIPLLLKTQFNHIEHLDEELTNLRQIMDKRFEQVDRRFEQVYRRFEEMDRRFEEMERRFIEMEKRFMAMGKTFATLVIGGFTIISVLITIVGFIK